MGQIRNGNSLWLSPTASQAGSELSIDTYDDQSSSLTTPLTTPLLDANSFSFSQFDDVIGDDCDVIEERRQVEELQEQLRKLMMTSPIDDVDVTRPTGSDGGQMASPTMTSPTTWSSERTMTITAEITSTTETRSFLGL